MGHRQRKKLSGQLLGAILSGDAARTKEVLSRRAASPERRFADGATPLYLAAVQGEAEVVRVLLEAGAAPDTESAGAGSEGTPLCAAACWGHTETVRRLLAHGADPGLREDRGTGRTPLEWAAAGPHPETAEVLRDADASVTAEGSPVDHGNDEQP
ncbi:ankyrin repeat domain-containing protein [Streptomyces sp. cg28]|uniref:ankyrin repeat domain-containing protein n=1 Tax=Streptomyces sp. cg28 TaxID=3403457 RepID=UPI003B21B551